MRIVHVSEDGRHLVAARSRDIIIIKDFERVARGEVKLEDVALFLVLGGLRSINYLAYAHGKVAVATVRLLLTLPGFRRLTSNCSSRFAQTTGFYIFTLDPSAHYLPSTAMNNQIPPIRTHTGTIPSVLSYPRLLMSRALHIENITSHTNFSCLQLTRERMYFTWDCRLERVGEEIWRMVEEVEEEEAQRVHQQQVQGQSQSEEEADNDGSDSVASEDERRARNESVINDLVMRAFPPAVWDPPSKSVLYSFIHFCQYIP